MLIITKTRTVSIHPIIPVQHSAVHVQFLSTQEHHHRRSHYTKIVTCTIVDTILKTLQLLLLLGTGRSPNFIVNANLFIDTTKHHIVKLEFSKKPYSVRSSLAFQPPRYQSSTYNYRQLNKYYESSIATTGSIVTMATTGDDDLKCRNQAKIPVLNDTSQSTFGTAAGSGTNDNTFRETSDIVNPCRILCLSDPEDANNSVLRDIHTARGAQLVAIMACSGDIGEAAVLCKAVLEVIVEDRVNTIFVSHTSAQFVLAYVLPRLSIRPGDTHEHPKRHPIVWIHTRSAGIDAYISPELNKWYRNNTETVQMTNARGMFSSTLAEYSMGACSYFCKDFNRLKRNQNNRLWDKYVLDSTLLMCFFVLVCSYKRFLCYSLYNSHSNWTPFPPFYYFISHNFDT
jgi:hypothetical protein